jgi:hypothetical protein
MVIWLFNARGWFSTWPAKQPWPEQEYCNPMSVKEINDAKFFEVAFSVLLFSY